MFSFMYVFFGAMLMGESSLSSLLIYEVLIAPFPPNQKTEIICQIKIIMLPF